MSSPIPHAPQGNMPAIGIPDSQDIPRLVFSAPYFEQVPLAELIEPAVIEAAEDILPSLVPPYVDAAAQAAVQAQAVLLVGSTMTGPLFLSPLMPTQPSQAATMAYVDSMIATAGIPEVPPVPSGQVWARETGQWVPITPQTGVFLPLAGGAMTGNINMSGNTIQNMAAVPAMPNGAAPAQWVLNQIASVSLYQGTWNADTNVPDLTQLSTHVNAYTWIAITTAVDGVVIGPAIPGLQGMTVFNGDTIIYSTVQGQFMAIHAGGLTLPEADARYVQLAGSQMSGALLLNANASQPLQAVTFQQLQAFVPPGAVGEAPNDGQLYGRNGLTASWAPVLPLAGGILTGALTLSGNATANLNPVPLQQMTSAISAATAGLLPLAGGTMTGLMTLSGNAASNLNPVPLQQLNSMLSTYAPLQNPALTGVPTAPTASPASTSTTQIASTAFVHSVTAGYLPLTGGGLSGQLTVQNSVSTAQFQAGPGEGANPCVTVSQAGQSTIGFNNGGSVFQVGSFNANGTLASQWFLSQPTGTWTTGTMTSVGNSTQNQAIYAYNGNGHAYSFRWDGVAFYVYVDSQALQIQMASDQGVKSSIVDSTVDALAAMLAIPLKSFTVTRPVLPSGPDPEDPSQPQPTEDVNYVCGPLAQDVAAAIPESTTVGPDGLMFINWQVVNGWMLKAIQELAGRLSALEATG